MRHTTKVIALMGITSLVGCSGNYVPANSPRISTVVQGGTLTYYKDGKEYPSGFFGGGTIDVVQGNPRAVAAAEKGHGLIVGGFVVSMVGLGSVIGGVVVGADNEVRNGGRDSAAVGLLLGGLAASIVGSVLVSSGVPHYYDAIAIYNDGVPPPLPAYGAPYPQPAHPPGPPPVFNPQQTPPPEPAPGTKEPAGQSPGAS